VIKLRNAGCLEICAKQKGHIILIEILYGKIQLGGQIIACAIIINQKWILEEYFVGCKLVGNGKSSEERSKKSLRNYWDFGL
jgi:hypothetical protein